RRRVEILRPQRSRARAEEEDLEPVATQIRMSVLSRRVQLHDRFRLRVAGDSLSGDVDVAGARARGREVEARSATGLRQREWARLVRGAVRRATEIPNRVP